MVSQLSLGSGDTVATAAKQLRQVPLFRPLFAPNFSAIFAAIWLMQIAAQQAQLIAKVAPNNSSSCVFVLLPLW